MHASTTGSCSFFFILLYSSVQKSMPYLPGSEVFKHPLHLSCNLGIGEVKLPIVIIKARFLAHYSPYSALLNLIK